jgi:hypothetical protein
LEGEIIGIERNQDRERVHCVPPQSYGLQPKGKEETQEQKRFRQIVANEKRAKAYHEVEHKVARIMKQEKYKKEHEDNVAKEIAQRIHRVVIKPNKRDPRLAGGREKHRRVEERIKSSGTQRMVRQ